MKSLEAVRPSIAASWRRMQRLGLRRDSEVGALATVDLDSTELDSALVRAASPVIEDLAHQLSDTDCALLLADRTQRIVVSRFGIRRIGTALDQVAAVPGAMYSEQTSGTNAIATVFETRAGGFVLADEHYLAPLHRFRCYGHPINHPITGALEGVLDITGLEQESQGLMKALVVTAARAIENQLLIGSPASQIRLLSAFQARKARSRHAVVAFGRDVTLSNEAASRWVGEETLQELRVHCADAGLRSTPWTVELQSADRGRAATARISPVDGVPGSFVVEVPHAHPAAAPRPQRAAGPETLGAGDVLIVGEPGSGRTRAAYGLAGARPVLRIGPSTSAREARSALRSIRGDGEPPAVLLDDVDRFDHDLSTAVVDALGDPGARGNPAALLLATAEELDLTGTGLWGDRLARRTEIAPLRERRGELPRLAKEILAEITDGASAAPRVTGAAVEQMARYPWPGNVAELKAALTHAVASGEGVVDVTHLPRRLARFPRRRLTPLEAAEYRTIALCLERHDGNKSHVARELGIGRSTLYRRLRSLGLGD